MSDQTIARARERKSVATSSLETPLTYYVTVTDDGTWIHAASSDFVFAYESNSLTSDEKKILGQAFEQALGIPNKIKKAVEKITGQAVAQGVYIGDFNLVINALNSIDGMAQTSENTGGDSGNRIVADITDNFFQIILSGLGGDVKPLQKYLTGQMQGFQAALSQNQNFQNFGTVIGTVSLVEGLDVPVTSFQYIYSNYTTAQWVEQLSCSSVEKQSYSYNYTDVTFLYDPN
ncbi:hypothetical protein GR157_13990 [Burkholderia sp. 4701]|nr:hypothetical protein [Burkholderia sp. 4701]MXN85508.1 hypothetical protein [Burkholderia sp. 4812]